MNFHHFFRNAAVTLLTGMSLLGTQQITRADVINFDTVGDGTRIDTTYPGVTFINPGSNPFAPADGHIYARSTLGAASAPNSVTVNPTGLPFFDRRSGGVQATFATPQRTVSIDARTIMPPEYFPPVSNRPYLQAFDAGNNFLGIIYFAGDQTLEQWETLTFTSSSANIKYVQFSCQNGNGSAAVYAEFDNLQFETSNVRNVTALLSTTSLRTFQPSILYRDQYLMIRNSGSTTINGPISVRVINPNWTLSNASGTYNGQPYVTVSANNLAPNSAIVVLLRFRRPRPIVGIPYVSYGLEIYSGTF